MTQCANTEKNKKIESFQDGGYMGKENIFLKTEISERISNCISGRRKRH